MPGLRWIERFLAVGITLPAAVAAPFAIAADPFPARPVRWLAPVLAGGGGDLIARAIAPRLSEIWGQPVVIDNRPGGGGTLGMAVAAKAAPDGYTMVLGVMSFVGVAPAVYPKLAYDPLRDFAAVTQILSAPMILTAHPSLPARNVGELIALAKAKPGAVSYGTPGNGTAGHLATALVANMGGVKMLHVPYRGAPPALADVIAGQITLYMATIPGGIGLVKAGRLKILGTSGAARARVLPDVPTFSESGLKGYDVTTWYGVHVPAATPAAIVSRMHGDIGRVIRMPEVQDRFSSEGGDVVGSAPADYATFVAAEITKWTRVARAADIRPD